MTIILHFVTYKFLDSCVSLSFVISSFKVLSLVVKELEVSEEDDLVNFFRCENFVNRIGVEKTESLIIKTELTSLHPDN